MIQTITTPELTSAKPRCGLQSVSSILPRLIAYYECQADARRHLEADSIRIEQLDPARRQQATFAFYQ